MRDAILGIHHITAITVNAQRNYDFYTGVLGLKLVKKTVNFDDPSAYHLYYGDSVGRPGSILTFFVWDVPRGRAGSGEISVITFAADRGAIDFWKARLAQAGLAVSERMHGDERVLGFADPDGLSLQIASVGSCDGRPGNATADIEQGRALRGIHSATLCAEAKCASAPMLIEMGYESVSKDGEDTHYENRNSPFQSYLELIERPDLAVARLGAGSVHHIAFRVKDDEIQLRVKKELHALGMHETAVIDRKYFHSVYFRQGSDILFEIATDNPGFGVDEKDLGSTLLLPSWLERDRAKIEAGLPPLVTQ